MRLAANEHVVVPSARYDLDTLAPLEHAAPADHWAFAIREARLTREQVRIWGAGLGTAAGLPERAGQLGVPP
jgi:hypothetical protein